MILHHHALQIELDDSWWVEAGMSDFVPYGRAYRVDGKAIADKKVWEVRIEDIAPVTVRQARHSLGGPLDARWGARHATQLQPVDEVFGWSLDASAKAEVDRILQEEITDPVGPEFMAPPARS